MSDGVGPCWQYLVKRENEAQCPAASAELTVADTIVRQIDFSVAKAFIEKYEWLGNMGSAQLCYGLIAGDQLLAVSCYTRAVAPGGFRCIMGNEALQQIYQLCRGATAPYAPKWAGSRVIGRSLKMLRKKTGAKFVVAYADPRAGEIGVVYQSANAIYLGMTDARGPGEYIICGHRLTPRTVYRRFGSARDAVLRKIDPSYVRLQRVKKHRYVFVLERGRSRRIALTAISHLRAVRPKRESMLSGE